MPNLSFDQKYSNSYGACVSSITSYRRKRCVRNDEFAEVEKDLLRNIQECKSLLAEHDERCRNTPTGRNDEELITNIPVLRAMKNVVLLDRDRMLQRAISTWKEFTCAKRQIENRGKLLRKACRKASEDIAKHCIVAATKSIVAMLSLKKTKEIDDVKTSPILKWNRSRLSKHANTTRLDSSTGDGRMSYFALPAPDLSRYKSSRRPPMAPIAAHFGK